MRIRTTTTQRAAQRAMPCLMRLFGCIDRRRPSDGLESSTSATLPANAGAVPTSKGSSTLLFDFPVNDGNPAGQILDLNGSGLNFAPFTGLPRDLVIVLQSLAKWPHSVLFLSKDVSLMCVSRFFIQI